MEDLANSPVIMASSFQEGKFRIAALIKDKYHNWRFTCKITQ
jgi:hypothetical protein